LFMSIYIFKLTDSIQDVALFSFFYMISHMVSFILFAKIVKKGKANTPRQFGLIGMCLFFLSLLFLKEKAVEHLILLGSFFGFFNGMYWISYHFYRFELTNVMNRGNFAGVETATKTLASLLAPILGGYLIVYNFFGLEYGLVFILGALVYFGSYISFKPTDYKIVSHSTSNFLTSVKKIWRIKDLRKVLYSALAQGFGRGGIIDTLIALFLFDILKNEFHTGSWISFFQLVAVVIGVLYGKYMHYSKYKMPMLISGLLYSSSVLLLVFYPSFIVYVIFGILSQIISPFMSIPSRVYSLNLFHLVKDYKKRIIDYTVFKELFTVGFSRAVAWLLILLIPNITISSLSVVLILIAISIFLEPLILCTIKTKVHKV